MIDCKIQYIDCNKQIIYCRFYYVKCLELFMDEKQLLKEFGKNLRAERRRLDFSQDKLAEKTGLSFGQVIGTIERGEVNTSLVTIVQLLNALDLDFDKLIDRHKFKSV